MNIACGAASKGLTTGDRLLLRSGSCSAMPDGSSTSAS